MLVCRYIIINRLVVTTMPDTVKLPSHPDERHSVTMSKM